MNTEKFIEPKIEVIEINKKSDVIKTSGGLVGGTVGGSAGFSSGNGMAGGNIGGSAMFN